ncbi:hypothetical protein E2C01_085837 [Portunus trituberculatus]|uniref:Uncharacterized protein n=1 Tax=Portunus trituberculatus TaxID=210409 RepID=A0A5B7JEQ7_PORTR|nr:hypothetical protein [Portunus trituberculatus]
MTNINKKTAKDERRRRKGKPGEGSIERKDERAVGGRGRSSSSSSRSGASRGERARGAVTAGTELKVMSAEKPPCC